MTRSMLSAWSAATAVCAAACVVVLGLPATPALAAPCPWSLTPTCVAVTQTAPTPGGTVRGTVPLSSRARQNEPARGAITHVEWWLYHPSFRTQNPNNEEGKVLLDERVGQPPTSGTLTDGIWNGTWTVPASRSTTARDGDYLHDGLRTYSLPLDGQYSIETHVLDAEWDRSYGGPPGRSGNANVTVDFGTGGTNTPPPVSDDAVRIGTQSRALSGTNVYRGAGALVRYTGSARSPANQWGFEVSVSGAGVVQARSAYTAGMAIPAGGSVLSGHDGAADWLQQYGVIGANVTFPGGAPPPSTTPSASPSPTPVPTGTASAPAPAGTVVVGGASHTLDGTNVPRNTGQLVLFTGTARSPANQWGVEVAVDSAGKITQVVPYQLGTAIPPGGLVLSGHDASADWLSAHAVVGGTVRVPATGTPSSTTSATPAVQPSVAGRWTVVSQPAAVRAVHATQLSDGRVLLLAGSGNDPDAFAAGSFTGSLWDPTTGGSTALDLPADMFCSGQTTLADGRVLVQGGTSSYAGVPAGEAFRGLKTSFVFDASTAAFQRTNDTIEGHWYPTLTKLENGDVWAAGGYTDAPGGGPARSTEMFDATTTTWRASAQIRQTGRYWGTYPHMFLLADARLFYTGGHTFGGAQPGTGALVHDWRAGTVGDVPGLRDKELRDQAGSVLLPPAQAQTFLIAGGGSTDGGGTTKRVDVVDLNAASPAYQPAQDLPGPGRMYLNLTTLPDRTVLASNGGTTARGGDLLAAAVYQPGTGTWTSVAPDPVGRDYHSSALLLPDGRVAVFGSNPADGSFERRISVYEPPYLFQGSRPTVSGVPASAVYGGAFDLTVSGDVVSASLTSPGSPTHQTDTNLRLVDLPLTGAGATRRASVPVNRALLPPGPYMLTVLDSTGVPSRASWVTVR